MPQGTPSPSAQPPRPADSSGGGADQEFEGRAHQPDQSGGAVVSPVGAAGPNASGSMTQRAGASTEPDKLAEQGTHRLPTTRPLPPASASASAGAAPVPGTVPSANVARTAQASQTGHSSAPPEFYEEALTDAVTRLRADGGELVVLDPDLQAFVLRARVKNNPSSTPSGYLSRSAGWAQPARTSHPLFEEQPTVVLPAASAVHVFPLGAGIRGLAHLRRYPIMLSSDEIDQTVRREDLPAPDAACFLAVPIFRASTFGTLRPDPEVIGVLTLYNRTPLWTFSKADTDLLVVHADRIARTMALVELAHEKSQRDALLHLLETSGAAPDLDLATFATRLGEVARTMVPATAFALILSSAGASRDADVAYLGAQWEGTPIPSGHTPRRAADLPPWWHDAARGRTIRITTAEEGAHHREYCQVGWETPHPIHSLLVLPVMSTTLGRRFLGALLLADTHLGAYSARDARPLGLLALETALLIERAQHGGRDLAHLYGPYGPYGYGSNGPATEEDHQRQERAAQLAQFSNAVLTLNASLDLDSTADALVEQAAHFTTASVRMVFLLDEETQCLRGIASNFEPDGEHTAIQDTRIPLSWQNLERQLREQPYTVLNGLETDWQSGEAGDQFAAEYQIQSCLVLPMEQPEHQQQTTGTLHGPASTLLGALFVYTPRQPYKGNAKEIQLLQTLASPAARAISNAQLYENLQDAFEKQKELDRYKDDFILTVSHEFRTPLTSIEGYTGLISRHGTKLDQAKLEQFAGEIHSAMSQLTGMINKLADVNRMDNDSLEVSLVPVSTRAVAQEALAQQTAEQQERVSIDLPEDLWVLAEAERLQRIFNNLIGNALKYTETSCRVTAHTATREQLLKEGRQLTSAADQWVVIGVQDYGSGIGAEDQARLFQKFVRLAHSRTTPIRGTGLGLWICRRYAEAFGGAIWVESSPGNGSLFAFCLPLATPPSKG